MFGRQPRRVWVFDYPKLAVLLDNADEINRVQLAAMIGKTPESVRRYMRGLTQPRADIACRMADLIGCRVTMLFRKVPREQAPEGHWLPQYAFPDEYEQPKPSPGATSSDVDDADDEPGFDDADPQEDEPEPIVDSRVTHL